MTNEQYADLVKRIEALEHRRAKKADALLLPVQLPAERIAEIEAKYAEGPAAQDMFELLREIRALRSLVALHREVAEKWPARFSPPPRPGYRPSTGRQCQRCGQWLSWMTTNHADVCRPKYRVPQPSAK